MKIDAYANEGECRIVVEGIDTDHVKVERDVVKIIDGVKP